MKKLTIIIPLDPQKKLDNFEELNINKEKVYVVVVEGNNPSKNRNEGVKKSKTEFVAFINAHTRLKDNWLEEGLEFFKENPTIDLVGGPQAGFKEDGLFSKSTDVALSSIFGAGGVRYRYAGKKIKLDANETDLTSANLICRRKIFERIKFDETLYPGEDPKFISDVKKEGFKVAYSPRIIVYNQRRENLKLLAKQIYNYGKTRPQKERLLETIKRPFFLVPGVFLIYLLFLPTLFFLYNGLILPLIFYLILLLCFSFLGAIQSKNFGTLLFLILIYPAIHLSYGAGFNISFIRRMFKNEKKIA
jgi:cellulose synthase/poly-beta-1,6-N-acetylglucosamine synthase-like glycosyltransferase